MSSIVGRSRRFDTDALFLVGVYVILAIILLVVLYPLLYTVGASFSDPFAVVNGEVWLLPIDANLESYQMVFENEDIWLGYRNTVFYTIFGTAINIVLTVMIAYPLSRSDFKGRNFFMILVVFTLFFRGGLIPEYLVVRRLGMVNTIWAMLIPSALVTYNVIVMRTFFQTTIPDELRESALIDGASNTRFLLKIVLPLSGPVMAVMVLFYGVYHWNQFFAALIYLSNRRLYPLQLFLREILIQTQTADMMSEDAGFTERVMRSEQLKYAVILIASAPMLILYPFLQRFFVKGVMIGAIKG